MVLLSNHLLLCVCQCCSGYAWCSKRSEAREGAWVQPHICLYHLAVSRLPGAAPVAASWPAPGHCSGTVCKCQEPFCHTRGSPLTSQPSRSMCRRTIPPHPLCPVPPAPCLLTRFCTRTHTDTHTACYHIPLLFLFFSLNHNPGALHLQSAKFLSERRFTKWNLLSQELICLVPTCIPNPAGDIRGNGQTFGFWVKGRSDWSHIHFPHPLPSAPKREK